MRPSLPGTVLVLLLSTAIGILGPMFGAVGGQASHIASVTLSAGWIYGALSYFAGMSGNSKKGAAFLGAASLWVSVVAYYVTKTIQGRYVKLDTNDPTAQTTYFAWGEMASMAWGWCVIACLVGPLCGICGKMSRTGPWRLSFRLLIPVVVVIETTMRLSYEAPLQDHIVGTTWEVTRVMAIAVAIALIAEALWQRRRRPAEQVGA